MSSAGQNLRSYFLTCGVLLLALLVAYALFGSGDGYGLVDLLRGRRPPGESRNSDGDAPELTVSEALSREFRALSERVMPAVVSVHTSKERIYKEATVGPKGVIMGDPRSITEPGVGSGVIVSTDGKIITNYHVFRELDLDGGRDQLFVTIHGETTQREVVIVGIDKETDVAVLKLKATEGMELKSLPFGDSDKLGPGEIVLAFGAPFGLSESVTQGVISNTQRRLGDSDEVIDYIQTDAAINPGNSGGPLVNLRGEIIGINRAIFAGQSEVHVFQGVGLAQPVNEVKAAYERIISSGRPRGEAGLTFMNVSPMDDTKAAKIATVAPGSPAANAGLRPNDLALKIDGAEISDAAEARKRLQRRNVGDTVEFLVKRGGAELPAVTVTLVDANQLTGSEKPVLLPDLKIYVRTGEPSEWRDLTGRGWSYGRQIVLITGVEKDSLLHDEVVQGDILRGVNGLVVLSADEARSALAATGDDTPRTINIWRDVRNSFTIPLPAH